MAPIICHTTVVYGVTDGRWTNDIKDPLVQQLSTQVYLPIAKKIINSKARDQKNFVDKNKRKG